MNDHTTTATLSAYEKHQQRNAALAQYKDTPRSKWEAAAIKQGKQLASRKGQR